MSTLCSICCVALDRIEEDGGLNLTTMDTDRGAFREGVVGTLARQVPQF